MAKLHWLTDHQAETILLMRLQLQSREDNQDFKSNLSVFQTPLLSLPYTGQSLHVPYGKKRPCSTREHPEILFEGLLFKLLNHSDS